MHSRLENTVPSPCTLSSQNGKSLLHPLLITRNGIVQLIENWLQGLNLSKFARIPHFVRSEGQRTQHQAS